MTTERVVKPFVVQKSSGDPPQFRIHDTEQPLTSVLIAVAPVCQPGGDFLGIRNSVSHRCSHDTEGRTSFHIRRTE
jgi:hypothetical protein